MKTLPFLIPILMCVVSCTPTQSNRSRSEEHARQSAAAFDAGNYAEAQSLARRATETDPEFAEAWVAYGMASMQLQETNAARDAYERALSIYDRRREANPSDPNPAAQEVFVLFLLGRSEEAAQALDRARAAHPNDEQLARLSENLPEAKEGWSSLALPAETAESANLR